MYGGELSANKKKKLMILGAISLALIVITVLIYLFVLKPKDNTTGGGTTGGGTTGGGTTGGGTTGGGTTGGGTTGGTTGGGTTGGTTGGGLSPTYTHVDLCSNFMSGVIISNGYEVSRIAAEFAINNKKIPNTDPARNTTLSNTVFDREYDRIMITKVVEKITDTGISSDINSINTFAQLVVLTRSNNLLALINLSNKTDKDMEASFTTPTDGNNVLIRGKKKQDAVNKATAEYLSKEITKAVMLIPTLAQLAEKIGVTLK
jgi:hypothetical protein